MRRRTHGCTMADLESSSSMSIIDADVDEQEIRRHYLVVDEHLRRTCLEGS